MMRYPFLFISFLVIQSVTAQKKSLDHSVYDSWQSIGQKLISNDGKWVVYTIDPQEGDSELVLQSTLLDTGYKKTIPRGYNALITEDSRYVILRIKPFFKETREARIKKKKSEDMPKDSLAIIELGKDSVWKAARVNGYRSPGKSFGWVAYLLEKPKDVSKSKALSGEAKKIADSLTRVIDSLKALIPKRKSKTKDEQADFDSPVHESGLTTQDSGLTIGDADEEDAPAASAHSGSDLRLRNLQTGQEKLFRNVVEYSISKKGRKLLIEQSRDPKDSLSKILVLLYDIRKGVTDTLSRGGNEFKNFTMTDDGLQVAYDGERDSKPKELEKYFKLWYFKEGMDSATVLVDKNSVGMKLGMTISENGTPEFSKSGKRLFFGTAPIQAPKDTSLVDIDLVKLDVWHYNDDYLQTVQLSRLSRDMQQNFLTVYEFENSNIRQLASEEVPAVYQTNEGDGDTFVGVTDAGKRLESQWTGATKKDIYAINVKSGTKKLLKKDLQGVILPSYISPTGKYIMWYDSKARNYFTCDGDSTRNITAKIKSRLYNEENDSPAEPSPYGVMKWLENDEAVFVYDKYSVWKVNPSNQYAPSLFIGGRGSKTQYRYINIDTEEKFIKPQQTLVFRTFNEGNKQSGLWENQWSYNNYRLLPVSSDSNVNIGPVTKAKNSGKYIYTKETYFRSPDLYWSNVARADALTGGTDVNKDTRYILEGNKLSAINPQQKDYNWGTAELYKWKTFKGKPSEGILYKPENFDPSKKYPLILYFYERLSNGLHNYIPPSPTPSRLNISFFVSRGYLVFAPDIVYTIGHPAKSAYDYIVSAAKDLTKHRWVDAKNIGIQGQSWGGIQVAQLVTMTDMFKAAWAGAPVANMTSAYGGIRWESGANRQFQYEKTQSRIGATLWEKPALYIENSPLFHLPKVKTPLVIMANDADGAVPWYQGIELFTAMRRLGKKVWMLNYNGEAHNLVQRKNRKDIQVREQQYFDWLLKGEKPAKWITEGVPAVKKGKDWGLEIVD
ncbi:MAG: alpha/beta hydrolase family protein [Chitinophagaceae bacterium]